MTNREKIIVGLMVLTVGYGAIELLLPRRQADLLPSQAVEGVNAFIAKVADAVKTASTDASALIINKAEAAWKQDPFLEVRKPPAHRPDATSQPKDTVRPAANLVYSGFIEIGSRRVAIINGMEYEAGDTVNPGGFTVRSVLPTKVLMTAAQREGTAIELPLQEIE